MNNTYIVPLIIPIQIDSVCIIYMTNIDYECIIHNLEKRLFNKFCNYDFEIEKIKNNKNYDKNLTDILVSKIMSLIIMKMDYVNI